MTVHLTWTDAAIGTIGLAGVLVAWEITSRSGMVSPTVFPAPTAAVATTLARIPPAELLDNVGVSLGRILSGFALGALLGIVIGIGAGWYRWAGALARPLIELLRPIPPLAWIPMAIVWFGLGEPSKVFVIFLGAFFPIVTNAYKGMTGIDPVLLRAAQTMGLRGPRLLFQVAVPAALPDLATGLRVGWGLSFGILVAAELIAAESGLGSMIMRARELGEVGIIIFGIVAIGLLNLATDACIGALIRRRLARWHAV